MERLHDFLYHKNPTAAAQAVNAIKQACAVLEAQPDVGRPAPDGHRDWPISFGASGYIVRYVIDGDTVTALSVWHQRELGQGADEYPKHR
jgi:plasmid stabilization system protein ParE